jgi:hypothetical protein
MRQLAFILYVIFPVALNPGIYAASNRNEYRAGGWKRAESRQCEQAVGREQTV